MEPVEEPMDPGEAALVRRIIDANIAMTAKRGATTRRAQHPKHHGCVRAAFTVRPSVPPDLAVGVFAEPRSYDALVRFSNGKALDDREGDAHGMAIKLLGVPGPKLHPDYPDGTTQDFILVDSETFFMAGVADYATFNTDVAAKDAGGLRGAWATARLAAWLALLDRGLGGRVKAFVAKKPASPLATDYFSAVPYALGAATVKYVARAGQGGGTPVGAEHGLASALARDLATPATFEFGVHRQTDAARQPVEDPTVAWSGNGAAYHALATLSIPAQAVDSADPVAERLSFSPWNALAAHRPLGAINRVRRAVYAALACHRHQANGVTPPGAPGP